MASDRRGTDKLLAPAQIRAARALLGWSRGGLAQVSGVSASTLKSIESGLTDPKASTLIRLSRTFENHGLRFMAEHEWIGVACRVTAVGAERTGRSNARPHAAREPTATETAPAQPASPQTWIGGLLPPALRRKA